MDIGLSGAPQRIRVWDLPTRLTHWMLVLMFVASWATAEWRLLDWHKRSGYAMLALVLFRIYWGFAGSSTARFASFCPMMYLSSSATICWGVRFNIAAVS